MKKILKKSILTKSMLTKLLSILIAAFMLLALLSACGQKKGGKSAVSAPKEEKYDLKGYTVRLANPWEDNNPNKSSPTYKEYSNEIKKIEKKYNCKIQFILNANEQSTFVSSIMAGDPDCDIAYFDCAMYPGVFLKNLAAPLDDYIDFSLKQWSRDVTDMGIYNGKHYTFMKDSKGPIQGIYFNKTIFEKNGLPDLYELQKNKQWTWDKLREVAKMATKDTNGDGKIDLWGYGADNTLAPEFAELLGSNGGSFMKKENGKYIFSMKDPAVIEALQFAYDLYNVDKVISDSVPSALFGSGNLAMYDGGTWQMDGIKKNMSNYKIGLVWFPLGPKGTENVIMVVDPYFSVFPVNGKHPREAGKIITDLWGPHSWDADPRLSFESQATDEGAFNTLMEMYNARVVQTPWWSIPMFPGKVYFGYMNSIKNKQAPSAWVESIAAPSQKAIDDTWAEVK